MDWASSIRIDYCNRGLSDAAINIHNLHEVDYINIPQQANQIENITTRNIMQIEKEKENEKNN